MTTETETDTINPEVKQEALQIKHDAADLKIVDDASLQKGAEVLREIKTVRKRLASVFKPIVDAQKEALAKTKGEFDKYDAPLKTAEATIKSEIGTYQYNQEQIRIKKEQELQEQARKQAEEIQIAQAEMLEKTGQKDLAEAVLSQETKVQAVKIENTAKAEGVSTSKIWSAEVVDLKALIEAVAKGEADVSAIKADQVYLNSLARVQKEAFKIPGVKAVFKLSVSGKSY